MAKQKYSEFADALAAADTLDGTEPVVIIQDGLPVQTTTQDIADLGGGGASYLKYVALLTQTGTDAPVATVLENTLGGTVVWTYDSVGYYIGTLAGAFAADKTAMDISNNFGIGRIYSIAWIDANSIGVESGQTGVANTDDFLDKTKVEIHVHP